MSARSFLAAMLLAAPALAEEKGKLYKIDELDPIATKSYYSSRILKFLDNWPSPYLKETDGDSPVWLRAIKTPKQKNYIGMMKHFLVKAPLEKAAEVMEDFANYPQFWSDVISVEVISRDKNRALTQWRRPAPVFLMPELHYKVLYVWDKSVSGRAVYRQQYVSGNSLHYQDNLVVLEKMGPNLTRVAVLGFFDPDAGPFRGLVEGVIWERSMQNSFRDDICFRDWLEHPDWGTERIRQNAEEELKKHPVTPINYLEDFKLQ